MFRRLTAETLIGFCALMALSPAGRAQQARRLPVKKILQIAGNRYGAYISRYPDSTLHLYSIKDQGPQAVRYSDWTSGFFPGALWLLARLTGEPRWTVYARKWTATLAPAQWLTTKHDIGFITFTSFGNGYRITHDTGYREILHQAARSLATRSSSVTGSIRSWDNGPWHYPVIVDNLMNLELLFWAAQTFGDTTFLHIARRHLRNEIRYRFRDDGSTFHVLDFDPVTGSLLARKTWQGLNDSSCWARGQAWAIYGFTMAYRYTHDTDCLQQAVRAADYFIRHTDTIADHIPYWDFNDPAIPRAPKDASAAAIAADALLELGKYVPSERTLYRRAAVRMLESICSPAYMAAGGAEEYFLLDHSVVNKPAGKGVDTPVIYADYYLLEALTRL
jgi:hypothetical protein